MTRWNSSWLSTRAATAVSRSVTSTICETNDRTEPVSSRTHPTDRSPQTTLPSGRRKRFSSRYESIRPARTSSARDRSMSRSSGWVTSCQVLEVTVASSRARSSHKARLTRMKAPSGDTRHMPTAELSMASRKRSSA